MTLKNIITFFLVISVNAKLFTQSNIVIDHYTKGYGIDFEWIYDIAQDSNGLMWFATHTGLKKYDGYNYISYLADENNPNSISHNTILKVTTDQYSNVWAFGEDGALNKLDQETGNFTRYKLRNDNTNRIEVVKHFGLVGNQFLILSQNINNPKEASLKVYNRQNDSFENLLQLDTVDQELFYFTPFNERKIYLWTQSNGYYLVDIEDKKIEKDIDFRLNKHQESQFNIPVDNDRMFYFPRFYPGSNTSKIIRFRIPDSLSIAKIEHYEVDNTGDIWFYYPEDLLYHYNIDAGKLEVYKDPMFDRSLGKQLMHHFFKDREGKYWNGHYFGAVRFSLKNPDFRTLLNSGEVSSKNLNVRNIVELSSGKILILVQENKLFEVDLNRKDSNPNFSIKEIRLDLGTSLIYSMIPTQDGSLWLNQKERLIKINPKNWSFIAYPILENDSQNTSSATLNNNLPRIFEDKDGFLWFCEKGRVAIINKPGQYMEPVHLFPSVDSLGVDFKYGTYDPDNNTIIGMFQKGLYVIDCGTQKTKVIEIFNENQGYDVLITSVAKWKGAYWLTTNKGLMRYNMDTGEISIFNKKSGLPTNILLSQLNSEEFLWIGSQLGLIQFDPFSGRMSLYNEEMGLPFSKFNIWATHKYTPDFLIFGGEKGIVGLNPKNHDISMSNPGKLIMTQVEKFNAQKGSSEFIRTFNFNKGNPVTVYPNERNIVFEYILNKYDRINNNLYEHKLEGIDSDWVADGTNNRATYARIPPGNYLFKARAFGPSRLPANNEIEIPVKVKQYWYLRNSSLSIMALCLLGFVGFVFQLRLKAKLSKKEAENIKALDKFKSRMYTNITHEFRTPLTTILGMNEIIWKNNEGKESEAHQMIARNGEQLLNLVNQMMAMSRLEEGKLKLSLTTGDVISFLKYKLESLASLAEDKGIHLNFTSDHNEILMDFDEEKLYYIFGNLVSNAIKFSNPGDNIEVVIEMKNENGEDDFLIIKVKDQGIGIPENEIPKIFDRFYQVENNEIKSYEGSGIGLALAKELVQVMGGEIVVRSEIQKGSEFEVVLPIKTSLNSELNENHLAEKNKPIINENDKKVNLDQASKSALPELLIVEDNQDVLKFIETCLKDDFKIKVASNGEEGINMALEGIPDIVLSDVMMPKKDGYELCSTLKQDERTSHIPIVLITGKVDYESRIEGLTSGANAYLSKPINREELLLRMKNMMSLKMEIQQHYGNLTVEKGNDDFIPSENKFLLKVKSIVLENLDHDQFNVSYLSELVHMSRAQLHRKITALTGSSTSDFIKKIQIEEAKKLLKEGEYNVGEIAYKLGFKTQSHFSRVFSEATGIAPSKY